MKRVRDTVKAFESKFFHQMRILREDYEAKINAFREYNRQKLQENNDRMDAIEDAILKQREERIWVTEQMVGEVRD